MSDLLGTFYEARPNGQAYVETRDVIEAEALVVKAGGGSIVKWNGEYNMPNCLPKIVSRSCAMWVYEDGIWYRIPIFGGSGRWKEYPTTREVASDYIGNPGKDFRRIAMCEASSAPVGEQWLVTIEGVDEPEKFATKEAASDRYADLRRVK